MLCAKMAAILFRGRWVRKKKDQYAGGRKWKHLSTGTGYRNLPKQRKITEISVFDTEDHTKYIQINHCQFDNILESMDVFPDDNPLSPNDAFMHYRTWLSEVQIMASLLFSLEQLPELALE